jgi:uncharacterized protein YndB with AHSA1/START domain
MTGLDYVVERTVTIAARPKTVFRFFTDSGRFAAWWGEGSRIDPRPGGAVRICYPNRVQAGGEVLEVIPCERIAFTFGYDSGDPVAIGASRVTITLQAVPRGTRLTLRHELPTASAREVHVQGWRYQLAVFAEVAAQDAHAGVAERVDRFLGLWATSDAAARRAALAELTVDSLSYRDRYSCTEGRDDLDAHLAAYQRFMPGLVLQRTGEVRQCQGTALVDWAARGPDGASRGSGTFAIELAADGRVERVTGFWV